MDNIADKNGNVYESIISNLKAILTDWGAPEHLVKNTLVHHALLVLMTPCPQRNLTSFYREIKAV